MILPLHYINTNTNCKDMRHNNSTIFFEEDKMLPINYNAHIVQQYAPLPTLPDILSRKHFNHTSKSSASSQQLTSVPEFVNFADFTSREQQMKMPNFMQLKPELDINDDRIIKQFNKKPKKNNPVYKINQYQKRSKDYKILKQVPYEDVSTNKQKVATKTKKKPPLIILDQQLNNTTSMHESQQPIINDKPVKNSPKLSVLQQYFQRQRLKNAVIAKVKSKTQNNFSINIQLNKNKRQLLSTQILSPSNIKNNYPKKCESTFYILQNYSDYESSNEQVQQQLITRNEQIMQEQPIINETVVSNKRVHLNINDSARLDRLLNIVNKMKSMVESNDSFI